MIEWANVAGIWELGLKLRRVAFKNFSSIGIVLSSIPFFFFPGYGILLFLSLIFNALGQGSVNFFCKGQRVNIFALRARVSSLQVFNLPVAGKQL